MTHPLTDGVELDVGPAKRPWNGRCLVKSVLTGVVIAIPFFFLLASVEAGGRGRATCLLCRLGRTETTYFGLRFVSHHPNACSTWYARHVEPSHRHVWERSTCVEMVSGLGIPFGVGCRPGHYPIHLLSPSVQMEVYQRFEDKAKARELFLSLADARSYEDRLDPDDDPKGKLVVEALWDWKAAGYPGVWESWWEDWWKRHLIEHGRWKEWLASDEKLSFGDWKSKHGIE